MPPHNNGAGLEMRDTAALHRSVLRQLSAAEEKRVLSALVSAARIRCKPGMFPRTVVESLAGDLDRGPFKPPPGQERRGPVAPVTAACRCRVDSTDDCDDAQYARFGDLSPHPLLP